MRSSIALASAAFVVLGYAGCTGQDDIVGQICDVIRACNGALDANACRTNLGAAVNDYRTSLTGLSSCADCLNRNESTPQCQSVLVGRACDAACNQIPLALNATTSDAVRTQACSSFECACGTLHGGPSCIDDLNANLAKDTTLASDPVLGACLNCIIQAQASDNSGSGGASSASCSGVGFDADSNAGATDTAEFNTCTSVVGSCAMTCGTQQQMNLRFLVAAAATAVCQRGGAACINPTEATALDGSAGATDDAASAPTVAEPASDCYQALVRNNEPAPLQSCAACLKANPTCAEVHANCAACQSLEFKSSP